MKFAKKAAVVCCSMLFLGCSMANAAGIGFNRTRVMIENGAKEGSLILNNDTDWAFLVRGSLEDEKGQPTSLVTAYPPVMKMLPGKSARVRITVPEPQTLPSDRESVFWLNSVAVPAKAGGGNAININYVTRLKVFYRPSGVKGNLQEAIENLTVARKGNEVTLRNSSPFYISVASFDVSGKKINTADMIAPFSEMKKSFQMPQGKVSFSWTAVDELGALIKGSKELT